ncbi:MAG: hypothetical protein OXN27_15625, partial [Candidatus Poribacteria bacterium]|nr:hypothetical protein [Candidatus Poribacteria bacterium]
VIAYTSTEGRGFKPRQRGYSKIRNCLYINGRARFQTSPAGGGLLTNGRARFQTSPAGVGLVHGTPVYIF